MSVPAADRHTTQRKVHVGATRSSGPVGCLLSVMSTSCYVDIVCMLSNRVCGAMTAGACAADLPTPVAATVLLWRRWWRLYTEPRGAEAPSELVKRSSCCGGCGVKGCRNAVAASVVDCGVVWLCSVGGAVCGCWSLAVGCLSLITDGRRPAAWL